MLFLITHLVRSRASCHIFLLWFHGLPCLWKIYLYQFYPGKVEEICQGWISGKVGPSVVMKKMLANNLLTHFCSRDRENSSLYKRWNICFGRRPPQLRSGETWGPFWWYFVIQARSEVSVHQSPMGWCVEALVPGMDQVPVLLLDSSNLAWKTGTLL